MNKQICRRELVYTYAYVRELVYVHVMYVCLWIGMGPHVRVHDRMYFFFNLRVFVKD